MPEDSTQPEVRYLQVSIRGQKQVLRFEIPVSDTASMYELLLVRNVLAGSMTSTNHPRR